jgi:hypothetical protein
MFSVLPGRFIVVLGPGGAQHADGARRPRLIAIALVWEERDSSNTSSVRKPSGIARVGPLTAGHRFGAPCRLGSMRRRRPVPTALMSDRLQLRSPGEVRRVRGKLKTLARRNGRLRGITDAMERETRVEASVWDQLIALILGEPSRALPSKIRAWAHGHLMLGPVATTGQFLTRATPKKDLIEGFLAQGSVHGAPIPRSTVVSIVDQICDPRRWRAGRERAVREGLTITRRLAWATFSAPWMPYSGHDGESAELISCDLGLPPRFSRRGVRTAFSPVLVLDYAFVGQARIPTVVEAWGSNPLNYYFSPAPQAEDVETGLTKPWDNPPRGSRGGQREVVHDPVTTKLLVRSAYVAR